MKKIDAHAHFDGEHPSVIAYLREKNLKLLNVCFYENSAWKIKKKKYKTLAVQYPDIYAWCTSIDNPDWDDPDYAKKTIEQLEIDFSEGAVGCKVWKNIGMDVKTKAGEFLMIDDPVFTPIFNYLTEKQKPLLMHIGEPRACWRPLEKGTPHYDYYSDEGAEWHMYGRSDIPSYEQLIEVRDRMVAAHPTLKIIGAHLASLEHDVNEVAKHLDRFPNTAVDISGRIGDLIYQDRETVISFFEKYQDRILFGTDIGETIPVGLPEKELGEAMDWPIENYFHYSEFLETDNTFFRGETQAQGLGLSESILKKIYHENARVWYPGI